MRDFKGLKFNKTRVTLDDTTFVDCELTNCELVYSGGRYDCTNTTIRNCFPVFCGPAALTIALLDQLGLIDVITDPRWKAVTLETPASEKPVN